MRFTRTPVGRTPLERNLVIHVGPHKEVGKHCERDKIKKARHMQKCKFQYIYIFLVLNASSFSCHNRGQSLYCIIFPVEIALRVLKLLLYFDLLTDRPLLKLV